MSYFRAKRRNPNALPVLFRRTRSGAGEGLVDAILPTLPAKSGHVLTYAHVGQHSEGALQWMYSRTRPAKPDEYAPLLRELKEIYERDPDPFELVVVRKITDAMREERKHNESAYT